MKKILIISTVAFLLSCNFSKDKIETDTPEVSYDTIKVTERVVDTVYVKGDFANSEYYVQERLPEWFLKTNILNGKKVKNEYEFDLRMNPLYLEADFNGDGNLDLAIPIKHTKTRKVGFAIIHGKTNEFHLFGAGTKVKNGLIDSDNLSYIDIWKINREKINEPGLEENTGKGAKGELILENPSLQIEKSEQGGGQIYWDGKEYAYFHQTC